MFLERDVGLLCDKIVGIKLSSFQLLFILKWEISHFVVANKKLPFNFVIYRELYSCIRILREESFVYPYFTSRVVINRISRKESFKIPMLETLYEMFEILFLSFCEGI